jgi:hypothetical protein
MGIEIKINFFVYEYVYHMTKPKGDFFFRKCYSFSEGSDQNWTCTESALSLPCWQPTSILVRAFWNVKLKVLNKDF